MTAGQLSALASILLAGVAAATMPPRRASALIVALAAAWLVILGFAPAMAVLIALAAIIGSLVRLVGRRRRDGTGRRQEGVT